jgi:hypothetical protein
MAQIDRELLMVDVAEENGFEAVEASSSSDDISMPASRYISKKALLSVTGVALVVAIGVYAFQSPAMDHTMGLDFESKYLTSATKNTILKMHNAYRCMHNVPALKWDAKIAANAQRWAQRTGGQMTHSSSAARKNIGGYSYLGENLAWGDGVIGAPGVTMWYDEIDDTNGGLVSGFGHGTGHYTQVVWAGTRALGCGSYKKLLVCQYGPGGNMGGQFRANVKKPVKSAAQCGAPQKAASLAAYLASLKGDVECDAACKADGKGPSFGYGWSSSGGVDTTTCTCKKGKLVVQCRGHSCSRR